jgi:hypothetical protein
MKIESGQIGSNLFGVQKRVWQIGSNLSTKNRIWTDWIQSVWVKEYGFSKIQSGQIGSNLFG